MSDILGEQKLIHYNFWRWEYTRRRYYPNIETMLDFFKQGETSNHSFSSINCGGYIVSFNFSSYYYLNTDDMLKDYAASGTITYESPAMLSEFCPAVMHDAKLCYAVKKYTVDGEIQIPAFTKDDRLIFEIDFQRPFDLIVDELKLWYNYYLSNMEEDDLLLLQSKRRNRISKEFCHFSLGESKYGPIARLVGLWLWDNIKKNGGKYNSVIRAIEKFESMPNFDDFRLGSAPDYYHWLRRTQACIQAAEVLTFDKKNPESKKHKRSSGTRKRKLVPGTKTAE